MTVGYRRREAPAQQAKLAELDQRTGHTLPDDYRAFLAEGDGGRFQDNSEAAKTIFGVGDVPDWADLWEVLEVYANRVPGWLLPVASDEYGNLFCVSLRDTDKGSVWFWDHEEEADSGELPTEENLSRKADSWTAFLASLKASRNSAIASTPRSLGGLGRLAWGSARLVAGAPFDGAADAGLVRLGHRSAAQHGVEGRAQ
ncbi:MAG: SMI1/KNR4 family protein [Micromonosporaceae bacterium]